MYNYKVVQLHFYIYSCTHKCLFINPLIILFAKTTISIVNITEKYLRMPPSESNLAQMKKGPKMLNNTNVKAFMVIIDQ